MGNWLDDGLPEEKLTGRWQNVKTKEEIQFNAAYFIYLSVTDTITTYHLGRAIPFENEENRFYFNTHDNILECSTVIFLGTDAILFTGDYFPGEYERIP